MGRSGRVRARVADLDRRLSAARPRADALAGEGRTGRTRGDAAAAAAGAPSRHARGPLRPQAPDARLRRDPGRRAGRADDCGVRRPRGVRRDRGSGVHRRLSDDRVVRHRARRAAPAGGARTAVGCGGSERVGLLRLERPRSAGGRAAVRDCARSPVPRRLRLLRVLRDGEAPHPRQVPGRAHAGARQSGRRVHVGPAVVMAPTAPADLLAPHGCGRIRRGARCI